MLELETPLYPGPQHRAAFGTGVLSLQGAQEAPKSLFPELSPCCLQVSGRGVPLWATGPGKEPAEILSPTLQPGPQEGQILLQQGKLLSGSEAAAPAGRNPEFASSLFQSRPGINRALKPGKTQQGLHPHEELQVQSLPPACPGVRGILVEQSGLQLHRAPHWETRDSSCGAAGAAGAQWGGQNHGMGMGHGFTQDKSKLNCLLFVMKASVVTQPCRWEGARALPPCRAAIEELVNSWGAGESCQPGTPRASTQHPAPSSAPPAAPSRFCSCTCKEGNPAPRTGCCGR